MALPLRVRAVNTPADSENKIHHDAVAVGYGFRGGLVPGVTVYGYMAATAIQHFGLEWLDRGAMDIRFLKPVYEGDEIIVTVEAGAGCRLRINAGGSASADAWIHSDAPGDPINYTDAPVERRGASRETLVPGIHLGTLVRRLDLAQSRITAPLDPFIGPERRAHPAILLSLANEVLMSNYELGRGCTPPARCGTSAPPETASRFAFGPVLRIDSSVRATNSWCLTWLCSERTE